MLSYHTRTANVITSGVSGWAGGVLLPEAHGCCRRSIGVASIDLTVGTTTDAKSVVVPVAIICNISTWQQQQHKSNTDTNTLCIGLQNTAAVGSGARGCAH